ncbi:MAG: PEGA domain-containing protein [Myxococcales bacterium]
MKPSLVLVCGALLCSLAATPRASAQAAPEAAGVEETPEYKQAVAQALEEYGLKHYEESRTLFERAHSIDPNARTLRGLGMVEFELRHYVAAEGYLEASLMSTKKALTEEQRVAVNELLGRTKQFIAKYELAVEPVAPAGMRVELDGKPVQWDSPEGLSVEAGEHTLRVSAPNSETREVHLDVKGGEQQTLRIELAFKGPEGPAQPVAPERPYRKLGIGLTSAGAAVGVVGGILGGMALAKAGDAEFRKDHDADTAQTLALVSDVAIGVGVATAVAGIVLLVWKVKPKERPAGTARLETAWPNVKVSF